MYTRRKMLAVLGGGVILAAGGSAVWATTRDPAGARRPWQMAGGDESDPRRKALSYAILAPNPHNRQPWLVDLSAADEMTLYCDLDRRLPETDPYDRQITVGLGCFIELLDQAAAAAGYRANVALFPEGEPAARLDARPVAHVRLEQDASARPDPLFAHVLERRSNKDPYDLERPVAGAALAGLAGAVRANACGWTNDPARVTKLRGLTWGAMMAELVNAPTAKESLDLTRIGRAEIEANPDGIDLAGPLVEILSLAGVLSREAMLDPTSSAFQQMLPMLRQPMQTAMAFLWLSSTGNGRSAQIAAGRDYIRVNLAATAAGIGIHPLSQSLQEFEAMRPHRAAMREALEIGEGQTLQMLVRLGYAQQPAASPRWPYETRIRRA